MYIPLSAVDRAMDQAEEQTAKPLGNALVDIIMQAAEFVKKKRTAPPRPTSGQGCVFAE